MSVDANVVKDVAASASVEVRSERVMPPADMAGLQEVPIELTVAGSIRETVALLYQIERTPKPMPSCHFS